MSLSSISWRVGDGGEGEGEGEGEGGGGARRVVAAPPPAAPAQPATRAMGKTTLATVRITASMAGTTPGTAAQVAAAWAGRCTRCKAGLGDGPDSPDDSPRADRSASARPLPLLSAVNMCGGGQAPSLGRGVSVRA